MREVSAAEELIEKGARASVESMFGPGAWDTWPEQDKPTVRREITAIAEAWFGPGWREGISREWAWFSTDPDVSHHVVVGTDETWARKVKPERAELRSSVRVRGAWQRVEGEQ